jgi:hypothetical protein
MRWLASRPWWLLAGVLVVLLLAVVLGLVPSNWVSRGVAVVTLFLLFFATLMALLRRRESPGPTSPR